MRVLATLDESSYTGGTMGADHPIMWCREFTGDDGEPQGRSWYTAGGHSEGSYAEPLFRAHLLGGILWAAGAIDILPCPADFDRSCTVDSQDFFDFVSAFFKAAPAADFNHDSIVNSQDFFDFLAAFFAGC